MSKNSIKYVARYFTPYKFKFNNTVANVFSQLDSKLTTGNTLFRLNSIKLNDTAQHGVIAQYEPIPALKDGTMTEPGLKFLESLGLYNRGKVEIKSIGDGKYEVETDGTVPTQFMLSVRDMFNDCGLKTYVNNGEEEGDFKPMRDPFGVNPNPYSFFVEEEKEVKFESKEQQELYKSLDKKWNSLKEEEQKELTSTMYKSYMHRDLYFSVQKGQDFCTPDGSRLGYRDDDYPRINGFFKFGKQRHILCGSCYPLFACEGGIDTNKMCPLVYFLSSHGYGYYSGSGELRGHDSYSIKGFLPYWTMIGVRDTMEAYGVKTIVGKNWH